MTTNRADLLLHPVRIRIAQAAAGRHLTTKELSEEMPDVPLSSIYRHVAQLIDGGFLEVTDARQVRGTTEKTFTLNTEQSSLGSEDLAHAGPDQHNEYFTAFIGSMLERATAYLRSPDAAPPADGFSYTLTPLWMTDDELADVRQKMADLFAPHLAAGSNPDRRRRVLWNILIPDPHDGGAND